MLGAVPSPLRQVHVSVAVPVFVVVALWLHPPALLADDADRSDKFQTYGYLSMAFSRADFTSLGPTQDEIVFGFEERWKTDYWRIGLQFHYLLNERNRFVVQVQGEEAGISPIDDARDEAHFRLAFWEHKLGAYSVLKAGRQWMPVGVFSESRDVNTVRHFYNPPFMFYRRGSFVSATVDGVSFQHTFFADRDWSLRAQAYAGGWDLIEFPPPGAESAAERATKARANDATGIHLWTENSSLGVGIGGGWLSYDVSGGFLELPGQDASWEDWYVSLSINRDRWYAVAEYKSMTPSFPALIPGANWDATVDIYHVQAGIDLNERFDLSVRYENSESSVDSVAFVAGEHRRTLFEDYALSIGYRLGFWGRITAEHHWTPRMDIFEITPLPAGGLSTRPIPSEDGGRTIVSLAFTF